mmetsp:Transcript_7605/g.19920  ORF Transcript_7605/g.19920 Transcript_7605/m.19920 type:complete len:592 (-) Transcript_7605:365-2140(-)
MPEIHLTTRAVAQHAILEHLQQKVEDVGMRLLHLVEEDEAVRVLANHLSEQATLVVPDVAWRRTNQLGNAVPLHVLAHVEANEVGLCAGVSLRLGAISAHLAVVAVVVRLTAFRHHRSGGAILLLLLLLLLRLLLLCPLSAKVAGCQASRKLCLAHTGGSAEHKRCDGPLRVTHANHRTLDGGAQSEHSGILAHHAREQLVLESVRLLAVRRANSIHGNGCPLCADLLDHAHLNRRHRKARTRRPVSTCLERGAQLLLSVAQQYSLLVESACCSLTLSLSRCLELAPQHLRLVRLAGGDIRRRQLVHVPRHLLHAQRELLEAPAVRLKARLRSRLVEEVDRLVGQVAITDVPVAEAHRGIESLLREDDAVEVLVDITQPVHDCDRLLLRRLTYIDGLESARERGILLDVLAVLAHRRHANAREFASCEARLEQICKVHATATATTPSRGTSAADDGVDLVNRENDLALRLFQLLEQRGDAVLQLAALLGARHEARNVKRENSLPLEEFCAHVVGNRACESLDDRRLAHTRIAEQDRVVLDALRKDLNASLRLVVASHDGINLLLRSQRRHVRAKLLERALLVVFTACATLG